MADTSRDRFVAERAASPCGNHLARCWQVGEGVSPAGDAKPDVGASELMSMLADNTRGLGHTRPQIEMPRWPAAFFIIVKERSKRCLKVLNDGYVTNSSEGD